MNIFISCSVVQITLSVNRRSAKTLVTSGKARLTARTVRSAHSRCVSGGQRCFEHGLYQTMDIEQVLVRVALDERETIENFHGWV